MLKVRARLTAARSDGAVALFVHPDDRKYCFATYKDFYDRKIECDLVIQQHHKSRTLPMNNLFHGVVGKIAKATKHTPDQIKQYLKDTYGTTEKMSVPKLINGKIEYVDVYTIKSTADYTIPEMSDLITGAFCLASDWGVNIEEEKKDFEQAGERCQK